MGIVVHKFAFSRKHNNNINNNNNLLHLYSAFQGTQSALHTRGESPQPPPVCSIHLDEVRAGAGTDAAMARHIKCIFNNYI